MLTILIRHPTATLFFLLWDKLKIKLKQILKSATLVHASILDKPQRYFKRNKKVTKTVEHPFKH